MALNVLPPKATNTAKSFLDYLIEQGLIKQGFSQILSNKYLDEIESYLLKNHLISEKRLAQAYSDFFGLPLVRLVSRPLKPEVARLLPESVARKYGAFVYDLKGLDLYMAIGEPSMLQQNAPDALTKLRQQKGLRIHLAIAPRADVLTAIDHIYGNSPAPKQGPERQEQAPARSEEESSQPVSKAPQVTKSLESHVKNIDLVGKEISAEILTKVPIAVARRYKIVVFGQEEAKGKFEPPLIKVAAVNPNEPRVREILTYIEQKNKVLVDRYQTSETSLKRALEQYPGQDQDAEIEDESPEPTDAMAKKDSTDLVAASSTVESVPPAPAKPVVKVEAKEKDNENRKPILSSGSDSSPKTPGLTLSPGDIVNKPSEEANAADLQRLAKEQEVTLENQNLDRLLRGPITSVDDLAKVFKGGVIPEIVAAVLFLAIRMKASDVHIEAGQETVRLRYRVDGILHDVITVPHFLHAPLISRIKILSKMKIDEQRVPQDGRFDVIIDNRQVDLRVSTLPTVHGEKVVMRLLDKSEGVLSLEQLGITGTNFDRLVANVNKPYGIILSTGPTGSGKSTTLYAILTRISKPGVNIITLEDPVEYELPGINQAQVKPQIGFTFAEGLRSVLRQDPNVVMVGEVRDLETAAMATHAALTGHLVLSTLHTNDAAGALPRLINMGVEPFLITSSLNAVVGQRLVRKICDQCKKKVDIPPAVLEFVKKQLESLPTGQMKDVTSEQLTFYRGDGCSNCTDGYKGRIGIYEVLTMNEEIERLAVSKSPASEIKKAAIKAGMITMTQDGLIKALKGITTIDEILRVTTTHIKEIPGA